MLYARKNYGGILKKWFTQKMSVKGVLFWDIDLYILDTELLYVKSIHFLLLKKTFSSHPATTNKIKPIKMFVC